MRGHACKMQFCIKESSPSNPTQVLRNDPTRDPGHCVGLVPPVTSRFSARASCPGPDACFGRERGACDRAPKASADRSDFFPASLELAPRSHGGTFTSSSWAATCAAPGLSRFISVLRLLTLQGTCIDGIVHASLRCVKLGKAVIVFLL